MRQCIRDQSLLGVKKIKEHSWARINGRRQWSQRKISKAIAQDVVGDFVKQLRPAISHRNLFRVDMIVLHISWIAERATSG
jgi:hypothetical protein